MSSYAGKLREPDRALGAGSGARYSGTLFGRNDNGLLPGQCCRMRVLFNLNLWHTPPVSSYISHSDYYTPLGGGDSSQVYVKEVSGRIERSAKQRRRILSELHNETMLWITERVAAEHRRTKPAFTAVTFASKYRQ